MQKFQPPGFSERPVYFILPSYVLRQVFAFRLTLPANSAAMDGSRLWRFARYFANATHASAKLVNEFHLLLPLPLFPSGTVVYLMTAGCSETFEALLRSKSAPSCLHCSPLRKASAGNGGSAPTLGEVTKRKEGLGMPRPLFLDIGLISHYRGSIRSNWTFWTFWTLISIPSPIFGP
jgi:hypothetical protein